MSNHADPDALIARLDKEAADDLARAAAQLEELLNLADKPPREWGFIPGHLLHLHPVVMNGHGNRLCDALDVARSRKHRAGVVRYAQVLAALTPSEFAAIGPRLIKMLNSKELAAKIVKDEHLAEAIANPAGVRPEQVTGGYSLIRHVPDLYRRLGELGEPARSLIMSLGDLARWPPPLVEARRRLDRGAV